MVSKGTRNEVEAALSGWHPTVLALLRLLQEQLVTWGLFDLGEFPAPKYNNECVYIARDTAHASSPHHGAGACLGVKDALCLSILLGQVFQTATGHGKDLRMALAAEFEASNAIRRPRTQWFVNSSKRVCDLYHQPEWADQKRWAKAETCFEEIRDRSYEIWDFDIDNMVQQSLAGYKTRLGEKANELGKDMYEKHGY